MRKKDADPERFLTKYKTFKGPILNKIKCVQCAELFRPQRMGYNARYCSDKCKRANQRARLRKNNPEQLRASRKRSHAQTKKHPERLAKHRQVSRAYRRKATDWLIEYKTSRGCADCGYNKHYSALQLDHEGKKRIEIVFARSSIARLHREIKDGKCVVRCANCHSIKTWERKQKDKLK